MARAVDARHHYPPPSASLTWRQREVVALIAQGLTYKQIAATLNLSVAAVESRMTNAAAAYRLLGSPDQSRYSMRLVFEALKRNEIRWTGDDFAPVREE
jgi:DNA-binding NarL/FixJ family response regulator